MQDNTPNNWKTELENPDSFTREVIQDKTKVWEKLYTRLHEKPQSKFIAWYWMAAACLVVVTASVIISLSRETNQSYLTPAPSLVKNHAPARADSLVTRHKENDFALSVTQQKTHTPAFGDDKNNSAKKTEPINNNNLIADSSNQQLVAKTILPPVLDFDSAVKNTTAAAPVKKKLRIVHLNEIGQPTEESMVNNGETESHRFELRIIYGETYNPASTGPVNNGLILSKLRNISN